MRFYISAAALAALSFAGVGTAEDKPLNKPTTTSAAPACTATASSGSGAFFDLRPDTAHKIDPEKSHSGVTKDYHARGWDYGKNFTLNICGAVIDPVSEVVGVDQKQWANVSAYYKSNDVVYSIG